MVGLCQSLSLRKIPRIYHGGQKITLDRELEDYCSAAEQLWESHDCNSRYSQGIHYSNMPPLHFALASNDPDVQINKLMIKMMGETRSSAFLFDELKST